MALELTQEQKDASGRSKSWGSIVNYYVSVTSR